MKRSEVIAIIERKMCKCECHDDGIMLMHCMPCCDFTYVKRSDIPTYVDRKMEEVNHEKRKPRH
ncbi:hypothetical protein UGMREWDR_CDS0201 [Aeromonas phage GomatiRiver_11]|nr:hypothetical protein OBDJBBDK_00199 [Aeromonas phage AhFM11]WKW84368.1 hypothetical protein UGMREWDR_CDS0201 [Aeromonas phage GomatiRiver_11]